MVMMMNDIVAIAAPPWDARLQAAIAKGRLVIRLSAQDNRWRAQLPLLGREFGPCRSALEIQSQLLRSGLFP